jgi:hypothetical protein
MGDVEAQLKRAVKWFAASMGSTKVEVDGIAQAQREQRVLLERLARDVATLNARLDHVLEEVVPGGSSDQLDEVRRDVRHLERSVRTLRARTDGR